MVLLIFKEFHMKKQVIVLMGLGLAFLVNAQQMNQPGLSQVLQQRRQDIQTRQGYLAGRQQTLQERKAQVQAKRSLDIVINRTGETIQLDVTGVAYDNTSKQPTSVHFIASLNAGEKKHLEELSDMLVGDKTFCAQHITATGMSGSLNGQTANFDRKKECSIQARGHRFALLNKSGKLVIATDRSEKRIGRQQRRISDRQERLEERQERIGKRLAHVENN